MPKYYNQVAYGLSQGLIQEPPTPIIANRAPTSNDIGYPLASIWIFKSSNAAYILTSVVSNAANWLLLEVSGGSGVFTTVTASGNITSTGGNISATVGSVSAGTTVTAGTGVVAGTTVVAGTGITATTGNISASAGNVQASAGVIGAAVIATGDLGGTAAETTLTNVSVPVAGGTGAFTITSATTSGAATNAGFLKMYVGTTAVFVPYYTTTA
jgi:hypothetical protein